MHAQYQSNEYMIDWSHTQTHTRLINQIDKAKQSKETLFHCLLACSWNRKIAFHVNTSQKKAKQKDLKQQQKN